LGNKRTVAQLKNFAQVQRERVFYVESKVFRFGDLTRADTERHFRGKPAASAPERLNQRTEADVRWAREIRLESVPYPAFEHPEAIEADYRLNDGMLVLEIRAPLVG
jgi:hypothetical protein